MLDQRDEGQRLWRFVEGLSDVLDHNVHAATVGEAEDFRDDVTKLYSRYQKEPQITITPVEINTDLQDIIRAVTGISGSNGQSQDLRVTPEGTIQAPQLG